MTPEDAKAVSREAAGRARSAARSTGGSWPAKVSGSTNGFYHVEDAFGKTHRGIHSAVQGKISAETCVTIVENADGTRSIVAGGAVEF